MTSALRTGIYTLGKTVTGLSATNFFFDEAKHTQSGQYCIFFSVDNFYTWDSGAVFETDNIQFNFYGSNLANLETLVTNFQTVFDFGKDSLTVTGYSVISLTRNSISRPVKVDKIWQIILEYRVETQKAR